ncbi:hypothetical protein MTO96_002145 [Rhipicephalus appendiculatus]
MFAGPPPAEKLVRLRPNVAACCLAKQMSEIRRPFAVGTLDLRNCIRLESYQVTENVLGCTQLQSLRCIACPLKFRHLLKLMTTSLRHLAELELSLVSEVDGMTRELCIRDVAPMLKRNISGHGLHRLYVEVACESNFVRLSTLLSLCRLVKHVHVHFVRGSFWGAILCCRDIVEHLRYLETFTFTSELPSYRQPDPTAPLDFVSCAAVCGNVSFEKSTGTWSCVRLRDLVVDCREPRILPVQLVVVVVNSDEDPVAEWIRVASLGHDWNNLRLLCLLLFAEEPSSFSYPTAGIEYRESLRLFFSTALKYLIELNISSFHFGPDLDFAEVLQYGSLELLHALSVSPCALCRPSALRRLAQVCPDLADLDVRFERTSSFVQCAGCEGELLLEPDDAKEVRDGTTRALFFSGLARLTLSDVHDTACLWFIQSCSPTAAVRLCNCPSSTEHELLGRMLAHRSAPSCLILRHEQLLETLLLANMSHVASLEYLYILSSDCLSDDVVEAFVRELSAGLPRLKYLHVHYRRSRDDDSDERITWLRGSCSKGGAEALVRNGPCIQNHLCDHSVRDIGPWAISVEFTGKFVLLRVRNEPNENSKGGSGNCCLIVFLIAILIGAVAFSVFAAVTLSRRVSDSSTDDYDDETLGDGPRGGGGGGREGGVSNPPAVIVEEVTPILSSDAPSVPTPPAERLTICTMAPGPEPLHFPDDGLCDYILFDSLTVGNNSFAYATQNSYVQRFVGQGLAGQKTKYGMSVALRDVAAFSYAYRSPSGKSDYESYWTYNVFSWGFLHIDELQAEAKISDEMHQHALATAGSKPGTFLGIFMRTDKTCSAVAGYLHTVFAPTGVIVLGHLSYGDSWRPDCAIMPPINFVDPRLQKPGIGYGHSMRDAMVAVACLANKGVQTSLYVSVTMQARRYKIKSTGKGQALLYTDCGNGTYEQRVAAQQICDDPNSPYSRNIYYASQYSSPITYDDAEGYAITFENAVSLRTKICNAWSLGAIVFRVGLAVYDVNYDRRTSSCDSRWIVGFWSRFHFLMRLRDFLHQPRTSSAFVQECTRVT